MLQPSSSSNLSVTSSSNLSVTIYPGHNMTSGGPNITVAPASFISVSQTITTPTPQSGFHYAPSYLSKAPGTLSNYSPYPSEQPSQTLSASGTKTVSVGPTASGEVAGCKQFHTVKTGDSCTNIETTYGMSFTQFYAWNPSSTLIPKSPSHQ